MKSPQSLPRQIEQAVLRHYNRVWLVYYIWVLRQVSGSHKLLSGLLSFWQANLSKEERIKQNSLPIAAQRLKRSPLPRGAKPPIILALAVVSLTSVMGHRFYNAPKLDVGKEAPQTIYAPADASLEDQKTTDEKRKAARSGAISVLMLDQTVNQQIYQDLQRALDQGNELRQLAGAFPFTKTSVLSMPTQRYLRSAEEWEWRAMQEATNAASANRSVSGSSNELNASFATAGIRLLNVSQRKAVAELLSYRRSVAREEFNALTRTIAQSRSKYSVAVNSLSPSGANSAPFYDATLFDLSDQVWQEMQTGVRQVAERILAQGIAQGLPESLLESAIEMQVKTQVPASANLLATHLLMETLQPNLIKDEEQTKLRAERAAEEVKPETVTIRRGEVIVWTGEAITQSDFVLLDYFGLSRREIDWVGLFGFSFLVSGGVALFWLIERRFHSGLAGRDYLLIGLLTLSTPILLILGVSSPNLPLIGLLVGNFYGSALGATIVGLLTVILPAGMPISWGVLLASSAGGLLGGVLAGRLRSREELALLGGAVGITQGAVYLLLNVVAGPAWYTVLGATALQSLGGLIWSIIALGISPYLEHLFDLVTPIRLVELTNPNRPLLKRLASEAPGTFQHTLFVSTLAEAAARALDCSVELVRAGTLYHDIGKLHDPSGFIENQMGGVNKHDLIDDPYKSAEIIKKHVSEGLVMARRYRLPKAIQAFIPEHQGTMAIAYFYHQAQQRAQQSPNSDGTMPLVLESDFRYDGPIPQSRETGILMLADSCEAALRSLKDATYDEALIMINKILRARWQDKQLSDSGLTREEMSQIATIFVQVWQQFNHQRIAYPKSGKLTVTNK